MKENFSSNSSDKNIAVIIPAFRVEDQISRVISAIPAFVDEIIVVNDASPDATRDRILSNSDPRLHLLSHINNQGVGGAMLTGYSYALSLGADIIVKVDGDGQMDMQYLAVLIDPILQGLADYTKGNRFLHPLALKKMPYPRKVANLGLTFMTKLASGYWNIFDPANGYTAISAEKLRALDPDRIARNYFFETSMLCELRKLNAVVEDISMPAIYQDETSSVKIPRELFVFSKNLFSRTINRIFYRYFLYDFNAVSFYLISSLILGLFGVIWGITKWAKSAHAGIPATTGTVLIAVLPIILAVQFFVHAFAQDIDDVPHRVHPLRYFDNGSPETNLPPMQKHYIDEAAHELVFEESIAK